MYFKEILGQVAENQARRHKAVRRSLCGDALIWITGIAFVILI